MTLPDNSPGPLKVAFLNPPAQDFRKVIRSFDCATESKANYLYQPYDFLILSARMGPGDTIEFLDAVASRWDREHFRDRLGGIQADVIVFAMADCHWSLDFEELQHVRRILPEVILLVFGDAFLEKEAVEQVRDLADGVITNPCTFELEAVLKHRAEGGGFGRFPQGKAQKFFGKERFSLGMPRHELFLSPAYRWPFSTYFRYSSVFTTWGCPFPCRYCIVSSYPYFCRELSEVFEELARVKELGVKELYFADRSFGVNVKRTTELLEGALGRGLRFSWSAYFHPNCYDKSLLELFKRSGCHTLIIGVEASKQELVKPYQRNLSVQKLNDLLGHARKLGINICGDFIIGLPGQTARDVQDSVDYAVSLGLDYASFNVLAPLPGTAIRQQAVSNNLISLGKMEYDTQGGQAVLSSDVLTGEEILQLKVKAVQTFYLRYSYVIGRVLRLRGWQHLVIQLQEMIALFRKNRAFGMLWRASSGRASRRQPTLIQS